MKGLVHIYTGNGKGKTTAAVGLGVRAYGRGFRVLMVQFLKGLETGELAVISQFEPRFKLLRGKEVKKFTWNMTEKELAELKKSMQEIFDYAVSEAKSGGWDMLILDEILGSISSGLITVGQVLDFIKNKPEELEVVMTGRNAPEALVEVSDYVSEIHAVKHPFEKGIPARKGIEC
ncbi:MAG: cob(I)yrinic acid a,c-diamide adenosyltransferase [Clostridiales bacterium]|jgi:cob(I)alamin adenosyltransferase|nr:cob(I)yrinic acid a,c-diamide adenosyltransferase [Eubacteriales bacterium]MDH7565743.1 cob(I)yrinic acid a,c-diamide adenosyltransferase [Clostridiales bacterium]